jgi:hypothetical protein
MPVEQVFRWRGVILRTEHPASGLVISLSLASSQWLMGVLPILDATLVGLGQSVHCPLISTLRTCAIFSSCVTAETTSGKKMPVEQVFSLTWRAPPHGTPCFRLGSIAFASIEPMVDGRSADP